MGDRSTPGWSPWNRSRIVLNTRPAIRAQIRFKSFRKLEREKVCVPHREWRKRRAEGPSRPVASLAKGVIDRSRRGAGVLTLAQCWRLVRSHREAAPSLVRWERVGATWYADAAGSAMTVTSGGKEGGQSS